MYLFPFNAHAERTQVELGPTQHVQFTCARTTTSNEQPPDPTRIVKSDHVMRWGLLAAKPSPLQRWRT